MLDNQSPQAENPACHSLSNTHQNWAALEANSNPFSKVVMAHLKARDTKAIFQQELAQYEGEDTMRYVSTIERQGLEKGLELNRSLILRQLKRQVGDLFESTVEQINQLPVDALESLGDRKSLND